MFELESAWNWREKAGIFQVTEAVRVFHGPGEGQKALRNIAIDQFGDSYWITEWEEKSKPGATKSTFEQISSFLQKKGAQGVVVQKRPLHGVASEPQVFAGKVSSEKKIVREGDLRFYIQLEKSRHPGLFLDHAPLRQWLRSHMRGQKVLNTFAYTGSLSIAAGKSGASEVWTLDLANSAVRWAKENWELNELEQDKAHWMTGDVFEILPHLKRKRHRFDCIILDPPSFSHGKGGRFSTAKDLSRLHEIAMEVLTENGILITSINSANIPKTKYEADILRASSKAQRSWIILGQIDLPETFPTKMSQEDQRYLKGWILRSSGRGDSKERISPDMG